MIIICVILGNEGDFGKQALAKPYKEHNCVYMLSDTVSVPGDNDNKERVIQAVEDEQIHVCLARR